MLNLNPDELQSVIEGITSITSVTRFHGHSIIRPQSVADHSCRVAMLAYCLAYEHYGLEERAFKVSTQALFHDFSEGILKNDANSAIKQKYGIRELLNQLEEDVVSRLYYSDSSMSDALKRLILEKCEQEEYDLLKMADTLDFGLYVWHEVGLGNRHIAHLLDAFEFEYSKYPLHIQSLPTALPTKAKILTPLY